MGALDTAKEIGRIAVTSGLSQEIITLLEKKVGLLTEQVSSLEAENTNLKAKAYDLGKELERLSPKSDRLEEGAEKILALLFEQDDSIHTDYIAELVGMKKGVAQHHIDNLYERDLMGLVGVQTYGLTPKGRAYAMRYLSN